MDVAPFPCTEAAWPALQLAHVHEPSGRWTKEELQILSGWKERCLPMIPVVHGDMKPDDIQLDIRLNFPMVIFWEECYVVKFTVIESSEGGLDIYFGSHIFHVRKHLSVVDPVVQMVLLASCDPSMSIFREDVCALRSQKSIVPKGMLDMAKKTQSSPKTKEAPEVYTKRGAPRDGGSFVQGSGDFLGVTANADNHQASLGDGRNVEHNKILEQSKTSSGGSGSKTGDIKTQQQQQQQQQQQKQQHIGSLATGLHLWPSEVPRTHSVVNEDCLRACQWETMIGAMNSTNVPGSMNCNNATGCKTVSRMAPANCLNEQRFLNDQYQMHQHDNGAPVINFSEQKGEPALYSILGSSVTAQDSISTALKNAPAATATTWIVASAATHHATGNRALLSDFTPEHNSDIFLFGGDAGAIPMQVVGRGIVVTETMLLPDVWYVPGLAANLVSVSQLAELDYSVAFGRGQCYIRSTADGAIVGTARAMEDGLFDIDFLRVPLGL